MAEPPFPIEWVSQLVRLPIGKFSLRAATAVSFVAVVAVASMTPAYQIRAADPQEGSVATSTTMHHPTPGHDQSPLVDAAPMMSGHDHMSHMSMSPADGRALVQFPPEVQMHMLRNMRDHVQTLDGILHALASADYDGAAKIAVERLGLDSPSAASCKPKPANAKAPAPGSMDEMMTLYMPEPMRAIGLSMHTSASQFAVVAVRAATTHDPAPVMTALSRVTENCVACHAAYRLR
jgi:hypothetical protein